MVTYDVVVVGAGIAGSLTARELGKRGMKVALLDKARFPRPKACGEGILPHGVSALARMGLSYPSIPFRGLRYVSPSGIVAEIDFPQGHGCIVRREEFDCLLYRAAAATPNVHGFEQTRYDPALFKAHWIVGADGLHSQFHSRSEFRARAPRVRRVGLSTHVRGLQVDRERVEIHLHAGGEVYLGPSFRDESLVACLCRHEALPPGTSNEERVLHRLRSLKSLRNRIGDLVVTTPCLAVSPLGLRVRRVTQGNLLLVGDAAGAPDPVTGEGMSLAILSARAAAEAIVEANPARYERERRRLAAGSQRLGRWLLRLTRHPRVADRVVAFLAEHPALFAKIIEISLPSVAL